jgi:hypothetical protein
LTSASSLCGRKRLKTRFHLREEPLDRRDLARVRTVDGDVHVHLAEPVQLTRHGSAPRAPDSTTPTPTR